MKKSYINISSRYTIYPNFKKIINYVNFTFLAVCSSVMRATDTSQTTHTPGSGCLDNCLKEWYNTSSLEESGDMELPLLIGKVIAEHNNVPVEDLNLMFRVYTQTSVDLIPDVLHSIFSLEPYLTYLLADMYLANAAKLAKLTVELSKEKLTGFFKEYFKHSCKK